MGELQATIELHLQLHKFYNIDLFQRGYYHTRVYLKSSSKLPAKCEITIPRTLQNNPDLVEPRNVLNNTALSTTFQILYRNEEVQLGDQFLFKLHLIVDSNKITESLEKADLQLVVELWYVDSSFNSFSASSPSCLASRTLNLHFSPARGLHHHLPVMFGYYTLSALTITVHCCLVSLHQPYINGGGKGGRSWSTSPKMGGRQQQSNMENVFFGAVNSSMRCGGGSGSSNASWRMSQARGMHRTICTLLMAANTALTAHLETIISILPPWATRDKAAADGETNGPSRGGKASVSGDSGHSTARTPSTLNASAPSTPQPTRLKVDHLSDVAKECYYALMGGNHTPRTEKRNSQRNRTVECEEDFLVSANSDIANLCAENILLWQYFLKVVTGSEPVRQYLSKQHHMQRVKRFSEAFFVIDNPRPSATGCYDSNYQNYAAVTEAVRRSKYFHLLPPLPIECPETDGDVTNLPVVFEDQYQHVAEFARRRSIVSRKSDNFMNSNDMELAMDQLDSTEVNLEINNPPDVTKPEPSFGRNNNTINDNYKSTMMPFGKRSSCHDSPSMVNAGNRTLVSALLDAKSMASSRYEAKGSATLDPRVTRFDLDVKNSPMRNSKTLQRYKFSPQEYDESNFGYKRGRSASSKSRMLKGRSRSSESRVSSRPSLGSSDDKTLTASGSESEERTLRTSHLSKFEKEPIINSNESEEIKPPLPPRTDKMPKDFKPPVPPRYHVAPAPVPNLTGPSGGNSLRERLKNNLRLELRMLPGQESAYKKAKFKEKLVLRAQQLRTTKSKNKRKNNNVEDSDEISSPSNRRLESSLSMPYNLGANARSTNKASTTDDQLMRHSHSTLFVNADLWEKANGEGPVIAEAGSMPDLLASDTDSSERMHQAPAPPPRLRNSLSEKKKTTLSNVEVGLVSACDSTLMEVGYLQRQIDALNKATKKLVSSPVNRCSENSKSQMGHLSTHSSNSDITSEQSGWVSNPSRDSSISTSPGCSPNMSHYKGKYNCDNGHLKSDSGTPNTVFTSLSDPPPGSSRSGRHKSKPISQSPNSNQRVSKSDSKVHRQKASMTHLPEKESTQRSSSSDYLKVKSRKSSKVEVKKSQSLHKVSKLNRGDTNLYEDVPIPPPPKEFQDPLPGLKEAMFGNGFATTGRISREDRDVRKPLTVFKDRPRSESPKAEANRNKAEDEDDEVIAYETVSEAINEANKIYEKKSKSNYEKFNSLPSMRHKHLPLSTMTERRSDKKKGRKQSTPSDQFSEPTPSKVNQLQLNERSRTQSAPAQNAENKHSHKERRLGRRSEPIPVRDTPMPTTLADSKFSLLELFLEQQEASVWTHQETEMTLNRHKKDSRTPRKTVKLADTGKSKSVRLDETKKPERLSEKMNSVDVLDEKIVSEVAVPQKSASPRRDFEFSSNNWAEERSRLLSTGSSGRHERKMVSSHMGTAPRLVDKGYGPEERVRMEDPQPPDLLPQKLTPPVADTVAFVKAKEEFKQGMNFQGLLYSDFSGLASSVPYFHVSDDHRVLSPAGLHLIVCVHGLDGNSSDLRLVKTYMEIGLPGANLEFLMSERNQGDTFSNFETLTDRLVSEILFHIDTYNLDPKRISFVGHSLGNIIIRGAVSHPHMKPLLPKLHTFLSLSGPHLGTLFNNSGLVNMGMWFMQKWKKSGSLLQLALKDRVDIRQTFLYRLAQRSQLHHFKNILLCGSSQDRYVPLHSARIELCRAAVKDTSVMGAAYREMISNLLQPIVSSTNVTLVRFDIHHALPSTANALIGRAAHIAVLDSELFIEKFFLVTALKYFK